MLTINSEIKINRNEILNYLNQNNICIILLFFGNITKQLHMNINYGVCETLTNSDLVMKTSLWVDVYPALKKKRFY